MFVMTGQAFTVITAFIIAGIVCADVAMGLLIYLKIVKYDRSFPVSVILSGMLCIIMLFLVFWLPCTGHQAIPYMGVIIPADACAEIGI